MMTAIAAMGPCLTRLSNSMPSTLGIFRSVTMTSKGPPCNSSHAASPSAAVTTS